MGILTKKFAPITSQDQWTPGTTDSPGKEPLKTTRSDKSLRSFIYNMDQIRSKARYSPLK